MVAEHEEVARAAYVDNLKNGAFTRPWGKKSPMKWLNALPDHVLADDVVAAFPGEVLSREELRRRLSDQTNPQIATLLVLAWGEMRARHARLLLNSDTQPLLDIATDLLTAKLSRQEAYDAFHKLSERKEIPGLGPAYYTKLIYFLRKSDSGEGKDGFIMDQWTAKSINAIFDTEVVKLMGARFVSAKNSASDYERFCCLIEYLAHRWSAQAEHVEMTLFGRGGRRPDQWRAHIARAVSAPR